MISFFAAKKIPDIRKCAVPGKNWILANAYSGPDLYPKKIYCFIP